MSLPISSGSRVLPHTRGLVPNRELQQELDLRPDNVVKRRSNKAKDRTRGAEFADASYKTDADGNKFQVHEDKEGRSVFKLLTSEGPVTAAKAKNGLQVTESPKSTEVCLPNGLRVFHQRGKNPMIFDGDDLVGTAQKQISLEGTGQKDDKGKEIREQVVEGYKFTRDGVDYQVDLRDLSMTLTNESEGVTQKVKSDGSHEISMSRDFRDKPGGPITTKTLSLTVRANGLDPTVETNLENKSSVQVSQEAFRFESGSGLRTTIKLPMPLETPPVGKHTFAKPGSEDTYEAATKAAKDPQTFEEVLEQKGILTATDFEAGKTTLHQDFEDHGIRLLGRHSQTEKMAGILSDIEDAPTKRMLTTFALQAAATAIPGPAGVAVMNQNEILADLAAKSARSSYAAPTPTGEAGVKVAREITNLFAAPDRSVQEAAQSEEGPSRPEMAVFRAERGIGMLQGMYADAQNLKAQGASYQERAQTRDVFQTFADNYLNGIHDNHFGMSPQASFELERKLDEAMAPKLENSRWERVKQPPSGSQEGLPASVVKTGDIIAVPVMTKTGRVEVVEGEAKVGQTGQLSIDGQPMAPSANIFRQKPEAPAGEEGREPAGVGQGITQGASGFLKRLGIGGSPVSESGGSTEKPSISVPSGLGATTTLTLDDAEQLQPMTGLDSFRSLNDVVEASNQKYYSMGLTDDLMKDFFQGIPPLWERAGISENDMKNIRSDAALYAKVERENVNQIKAGVGDELYGEYLYLGIAFALKKHLGERTLADQQANSVEELIATRHLQVTAHDYQLTRGAFVGALERSKEVTRN